MENHTPNPRAGTIHLDPNKRNLSAFIAHCLDKVGDEDLTAHPAFYMPPTKRQRTIRRAGRQSLNAVLRVLLANVDSATSTVTAGHSSLAKQPVANHLSASRFSRALKQLENAGFIYFSHADGRKPDIVITVSGLGAFGISVEEWRAAGGVLCGRDSLR
ncbi:hypothetical protein C3Z09_22125 [Lelliottia aquatilis]|uniref:hypothetical protein n=1 Tax=Lelliottia aquatilis TaxID=2080838 RepID=UPI000CDF1D21|nr:hypothetical protein [Lelliottia aquatilis]POZ13641.1 hypothetical protein C3Z09_22125 [Lelliottia aquatilis]